MENKSLFSNLFIFEMANNHMGDIKHGLTIIKNIYKACNKFNTFKFAFKFQYRNIETFIHPSYFNRIDLKYIKRFRETNLSNTDRLLLKNEAKNYGFITICTPFDEASVDLVSEHDYDIIKIASCSLTDWPLLEKIAETDRPLIVSTAGSPLKDINNVVSFLEHRNKTFCLMHCVGEYPTSKKSLQLNQIDLLKARYADITIGYSTHESPDNYEAIKIAIAKGASVFERHVAVKNKKYPLVNAYSSLPENISLWLQSAQDAYDMCGISPRERYSGSDKEKLDLRGLQRGVFASRRIKKGEEVDTSNTFFAIPNIDGQFTANQMSKYGQLIAKKNIGINQPALYSDIIYKNKRDKVTQIVNHAKDLLIRSGIALPNRMDIEISHHYGLENFEKAGAIIINCINREYCKKMILMLPGQNHPIHFHKKKEETFYVLFGDVALSLGEKENKYMAGDMVVVERGINHGFRTENGVIFEEISTTHYINDSFYKDKKILNNKHRKTLITLWADELSKSTE